MPRSPSGLNCSKTASPADLVKAAKKCEDSGYILEAQFLYVEALTMLRELVNTEHVPEKMIQKIPEYETQLNKIRNQLQLHARNSTHLAQIQITDGARGHSYQTLFGDYMNNKIKEVHIYEPSMWDDGHFQNLISFLELLVKNCRNLRYVRVITKQNFANLKLQVNVFGEMREEMESGNIIFNYSFDNSMREQKIVFSNGVVIKIGRGLHFFKPVLSSYALGICDYDFRKCLPTMINVWKTRPFAEMPLTM